jgi:VWFA-related protein
MDSDMKRRTVLLATVLLFLAGISAPAQQAPSEPGTPVSVVVTEEPKRGKTIPPLTYDDLRITQGKEKRKVASLEPLSGSKLQLLLMIDDSAAESFNTEIRSLKDFVMAQPSNVEVAVGYMRNGMTQMTSNFTSDHAAAAKTIRLAMGRGGDDVSPYDSLTDALKKWPQTDAARREIVMISSGIEGLGGGFSPDNQYVNAGIEAAQKAGVVVYTIYSPSVGHEGHSFWRATWGQNFLAQLSDETGGEFYQIGFGSPVSFEPFLKAILEAQQHQYLLTFIAHPEAKPGLQAVHITVIEKDASLAAPDKVFVPASQ